MIKKSIKKSHLRTLCTLVSLNFFALSANAKIIQILHTNDLHASLDTKGAPLGHQLEFGGWAQIKTVMDRLTREAKEKQIEGNPNGIETIRLDAGDFSEGTVYYFPDRSAHVVRAFQALGYDAVTLGNHDWLGGARSLDNLLGTAKFNQKDAKGNFISPPLLAANVKISDSLKNVRSQVLPSRQIIVDGVKIGIFGLTTNEAFYKWITKVDSNKRDMKIQKFMKVAKKVAAELHQKNDLVIALTHIGFGHDRSLAKKVDHIDLVVGGHSHTLLESYAVVNNPKGRPIPIVQAGFNGGFVGRIFVDVEPGKEPKVISYEAIPVLNTEAKDPVVSALIAKAEAAVQKKFSPEVLSRSAGTAEVRLVSGSQGPTAFGKFAADSMLDATDAEVAVDVGSFHGNTPEPAGPITRRQLMSMYPRKFETNQDEGWYVYKAKVPGWLIKIAVKNAVQYGVYFSMAGISFDVKRMTEEEYDAKVEKLSKEGKLAGITPYEAINIRINQQKLKALRQYRIAAPEGLIRGAYGVTKLTHLIIRKGASTGVTIWDAMEGYLSKIGIIKRLDPNDHFNGKEYSPTYEDYQQELREEQTLKAASMSGEALPLKWLDEHKNLHINEDKVFEQFLKEVDERAANQDFEADDE